MQTATMTEQELDRLEDLLASDAFKGDAMTLDFLQGFLCAVASGPEPISPSVWIPEVLGDSPDYESGEQAQETVDLLTKFYQHIASSLANSDEFDLILYGLEENPNQLDYAAWSEGYVYGSQIGETNWFEAAGEYTTDLSEKMEIFFLLNGMLKEDALKHKEPWLSKKEEERALSQAEEDFPTTIGAIYQFWRVQSAEQSPIKRESPKVGRNDPCPCGSGKKFKMCCGKEQTLH